MPEHLRALVVILLLGIAVLGFALSPASAAAMAPEDFRRRRNLWIAITLIAFLSRDFWLFVVLTTALLLFTAHRDPNKLALYLFLVFAVPVFSSEISGLGLARQLFTLTYPRLLSLVLLLPAALVLLANSELPSPSTKWPDRILVLYLLLNLGLQLEVDSLTNTLRYGLYNILDVVLPYYVASRSLKRLEHFRDALMSFAVATMVLAAIGIFEFAKKWLLYASLADALNIDWIYGGYLERGENLRAVASTGQPIALGFVLAVACGLFLFLRPSVPRPWGWRFGLGLLVAGLVAPLSRGPWLGAAASLLVFVATGPKPLERLFQLGLAGGAALAIVLVLPMGEAIIEHLPFLGRIDAENLVYRQLLLESSLDIIIRNPFFGSFDFPRYLEDLRQGQGIIDVVNTYLGIALTSGLVGLGLFISFFLLVLQGLYRGLRSRPEEGDEFHLLGRTLFATLAGILVTIFTVSSITVIPLVYWSLAGVSLAYIRLLEGQPSPRAAGQALPGLRPVSSA